MALIRALGRRSNSKKFFLLRSKPDLHKLQQFETGRVPCLLQTQRVALNSARRNRNVPDIRAHTTTIQGSPSAPTIDLGARRTGDRRSPARLINCCAARKAALPVSHRSKEGGGFDFFSKFLFIHGPNRPNEVTCDM